MSQLPSYCHSTLVAKFQCRGEAVIFLLLYLFYCLAMKYNEGVEKWITARIPVPASWKEDRDEEEQKENDLEGDTKKTIKESNGHCNGDAGEMEGEAKVVRDPLERPVVLDDGRLAVISWYVLFPLKVLTVYTIPDCRTKRFSRYFLLTFIMSVVWICFYSYILVWMITIIGYTFSIPDTVMSLTFVAAGVSVQDALSGIAVVKEGFGDMAVSNAIGSNIFDVLICLGVPWLIKTIFLQQGQEAVIVHKGLLYSGVILVAPVIFLVLLSHHNNWRMDRKFGVTLLVWYFVLIVLASLYE